MAEKEQTEEAAPEEEVTEKATSHGEKGVPAKAAVAHRHTRKWVLSIVAIVVVLYLMLVVGGLWIFHAIANNQNVGQSSVAGISTARHARRLGGVSGDRTYNLRQSNSNGLTTTTTNTTYTQTQGVVTAVNSDSIVIAGGGQTQTITTNASTTYADSVKPAVNDTVVVVGTEAGSTITATQIAVSN